MLVFLLFIGLVPHVNGQSNTIVEFKIDSITKLINKSSIDDTLKIKRLNILANLYTKINPTKGIEIAEQSIAICNNINHKPSLCEALNSQAVNYQAKNDIASAIAILQKAVFLSDSIRYDYGRAINYLSLGNIYTKKSENKLAKENLDKALGIFIALNKKEYIARTYNEFGWLENNQSNYNNAITQFKASLSINEEIGNRAAMAINLGNLGPIYGNLSDYNEAIGSLTKAYNINKQLGNQESMAKNLNNLGLVYRSLSDYPKAIEQFQKALAINEKLDNKKDISSILGNISLIYSNLNDYKMAMDYQLRSLSIEESLGRKIEVARGYGNIGSIYINQQNYTKAMEFLQKALVINQSIKNKKGIAVNLQNIGEMYLKINNYTKAIECQTQGLIINKEIENKKGESKNLQDLGNIYRDAPDTFVVKQGISAKEKYKKAAQFYISSLNIAKEINALNDQQDVSLDLSKNYQFDGNYKGAYDAYLNYISIRDSITSEGIKKKITQKEMQYSFDKKETELKYQQQLIDQKLQEQILYAKQKQQELELKEKKLALSQQNEELQRLAYLKERAEKQEKQKQLSLSEKETQLKEVQLQVLGKQKALKESELYVSQVELKSKAFQRNIFIGGSILFLLVAFVIFLGFNNQKKLNEQLALLNEKVSMKNDQLTAVNLQVQREKKKSDDLLLNILPEEVAEELKNKGESIAKLYNNVTVLFTDFVGFTTISEKLTPTELVAEIHSNFTAFDAIIEKHGLEKIKTIGDAYLAVSGLPIETSDHALRVVKAAIDIRDYTLKNASGFQVRIGINSGPVIAGIVGVKKYAYDIWGDTVNTASRMEQNSELGKINVSGSTFELINKDYPCDYRGKIKAKNKGEIDMYFVKS